MALKDKLYDVVIIGGGINGCGIAADAALRGLSVLLVEKEDLASKTSSRSTKLIHGGLRYLEHYDFSLVKKALEEREKLMKLAPHLIYPLPFILPDKNLRSPWLLKAGLFLYDHLSRNNTLPKSRRIIRENNPEYFSPLLPIYNKGFLFYDCATDDARLTVTNAIQAKKHGAEIHTQTVLIDAKAYEKNWHITLKKNQENIIVKTRSLINATGPWVLEINKLLNLPSQYNLSLVKGSHIIVPQCYKGKHAYLLQNIDKRIVFAIPYHGHTLIGTTEIAFSGNKEEVSISAEEITYLLNLTNTYFKNSIKKEEIKSTYSGLRSLLADSSKPLQSLSRDYAFSFEKEPAPVISIYGGKITTYRRLAVEAVDKLADLFPHLSTSCTDKFFLPGGDCFLEYYKEANEKYSWLDNNLLNRMLKTYGNRVELILDNCKKLEDLGEDFGYGLYQKEVDYLIAEEWASTAEDILWRRTKLGLYFDEEGVKRIGNYLSS